MSLNNTLKALKESRSLVTIKREKIDENKIQGFLLDYSQELVLIQYVYDFRLDGLLALRLSDITSIESTKTDVFQTQLIHDEGLLTNFSFETNYNVKSWTSLVRDISSEFRFIIVEDENPKDPLFFLGEISLITEEKVSIRCFSGTAKWNESLSEIPVEDISSIQAGNNYVRVYARYFSKSS